VVDRNEYFCIADILDTPSARAAWDKLFAKYLASHPGTPERIREIFSEPEPMDRRDRRDSKNGSTENG